MSQDKNFLLVVQIKNKKKREKPQGLNANFLPRGQRRLQIIIVRQFRVILQEESKKKKKKKKRSEKEGIKIKTVKAPIKTVKR